MRLLALIVVCVASLIATDSAKAQDKENVGFNGLPEQASAELPGVNFFLKDDAEEVDLIVRQLRAAAEDCNRVRYNSRFEAYQAQAEGWAKNTRSKQQAGDGDIALNSEGLLPKFPKGCLPPGVRSAIFRVFKPYLYFVGGANVPLNVQYSLTGVDTFFGPSAYLIDNRTQSAGSVTGFGGLRMRVETGLGSSSQLAQLAMCDTDRPSTFDSLRFFLETGVQSAFGAQSSIQTFQGVSGTPKGFGSNAINESFQIPIVAGVSAPVTRSVLFDLYGGITLDSWTHTLQGAEAGAPGGPGFYAQNRRFTVDPTVGMGVRVPTGGIGGLTGVEIGINAELQFRPGSVVTAPSQNFPSETYYGTANASTNMAIMARVGIPIGGR